MIPDWTLEAQVDDYLELRALGTPAGEALRRVGGIATSAMDRRLYLRGHRDPDLAHYREGHH